VVAAIFVASMNKGAFSSSLTASAFFALLQLIGE